MKTFRCYCGARVYFENTQCMRCGRELAYLPWDNKMAATDASRSDAFESLSDGATYQRCDNDVEQGACNWLLEPNRSRRYCQACMLNRVVPDLSQPVNRELWSTMEGAKRRVLYSLNRLRLPFEEHSEGAPELRFDIKAESANEPVITGHSDGLITLDLSEANPASREANRRSLDERYRTPLGHFRHEIGHFYWQLLVKDSVWIEPFRELFGDERLDYADALEEHYAGTTQRNDDFVSHYASAHPWEDWAETFAHYLHMVDSLDTAHEHGLTDLSGYAARDEETFLVVMEQWSRFSIALNALNRSMGMPDAYPFSISAKVRDKLTFVHRVLMSSAMMAKG